MSEARGHRRPRKTRLWLALGAAAVLSCWALPWDLSHLATADGWSAAWRRVGAFATAFTPPDLSGSTIELAWQLATQTLAIAVLGVGMGFVCAYPLALLATRAVLEDGCRRRSVSRQVVREGSRLLLDTLRGVPDFAWAIVLLTIFGPTAITAVLAIAVHVAGILGKILSELWDGVPQRQYEALRGSGAGRLQMLLYGIQPLAGRSMLSFGLMRFECAVRNASVIGAVCGAGLGGAILQEIGYDNKQRAVTLLLATLALTVSADLASNAVRRLLQRERAATLRQARTRRQLVAIGVSAAVALSVYAIRAPIAGLGAELARLDTRFLRERYGQLLVPDLSGATLLEAAGGAVVPLAMAVLATAAACLLAACMSWFGSGTFQLHSQRFAPARTSTGQRALRTALMGATRLAATVLRGVPEVAWVWVLSLFFLPGIEAAVGAMLLHSAGILSRVFTETVDNVPYQELERSGAPSRGTAFVYAAVPRSWREWRSYALFQFESNVRAGVVLGIVGVGGIGFLFRRALQHGSMGRASTFLLATIVMTVSIDRISRRLSQGPRC